MFRKDCLSKLGELFKVNPIVGLLGPRQCGKTTLARQYLAECKQTMQCHYFDLEHPLHLQRLTEPLLQLSPLKGLIIIDEIQRRPELFPILRVMADEHQDQRFLILGSASKELIRQSSESLTGRISYFELTPFSFDETHTLDPLWLRGGFPRSFLAADDQSSFQWRMDYIRTFLEQDIPLLGIQVPSLQLSRFWLMLTHAHGNIFNASELGNSLGIAHTTVRRYLDILTGTFMMRALPAWYENISKRQVKSPKIYFRDSGILHAQLQVSTEEALLSHPKLGASWEGFAIEEIIRHHHAQPQEVFYWATQSHAELDLLMFKGGERLGFEFKFKDAPSLTKSMHIALHDLKLDHLTVIHPGAGSYRLNEKVTMSGLLPYLSFPSSS